MGMSKSVLVIYFAVFFMILVMCGDHLCSAKCSNEYYARDLIAPCIHDGTLEVVPDQKCCEGMKSIARFDCLCDILMAAGGWHHEHIVQHYIEACYIDVPDNYVKCRVFIRHLEDICSCREHRYNMPRCNVEQYAHCAIHLRP